MAYTLASPPSDQPKLVLAIPSFAITLVRVLSNHVHHWQAIFRVWAGGVLMQLFLVAQAGHPVTMLSVQYRMHPKISKFISRYFYQGQLKDGADLDRRDMCFSALDTLQGTGCCMELAQGGKFSRHTTADDHQADPFPQAGSTGDS